MLKAFFMGFLLVSLQAYALTVVELDQNGKEIINEIPKKFLKRKTRKLMKAYSNALNSSPVFKTNSSRKWQLDSIELAPALSASLNIGNLSFGATAGFRMMWERKEED